MLICPCYAISSENITSDQTSWILVNDYNGHWCIRYSKWNDTLPVIALIWYLIKNQLHTQWFRTTRWCSIYNLLSSHLTPFQEKLPKFYHIIGLFIIHTFRNTLGFPIWQVPQMGSHQLMEDCQATSPLGMTNSSGNCQPQDVNQMDWNCQNRIDWCGLTDTDFEE